MGASGLVARRARGGRKRRAGQGASRAELEAIAGEAVRRVSRDLGLDRFGARELVEEVLTEIALSIAEQYASKPSPDSVAKRMIANREPLYKAVASRLASNPDRLGVEEVEFIVRAAPEIAGRSAPLLYDAIIRLGASHLLEELRRLWELYGNPTSAECPRCGLKALTPDYTCIVCGSQVDEREFKDHVGFHRSLRAWARASPPQIVVEAYRAGYVYYEDGIIKAPSEPRGRLALQVFLSRREKEELGEIAGAGGSVSREAGPDG